MSKDGFFYLSTSRALRATAASATGSGETAGRIRAATSGRGGWQSGGYVEGGGAGVGGGGGARAGGPPRSRPPALSPRPGVLWRKESSGIWAWSPGTETACPGHTALPPGLEGRRGRARAAVDEGGGGEPAGETWSRERPGMEAAREGRGRRPVTLAPARRYSRIVGGWDLLPRALLSSLSGAGAAARTRPSWRLSRARTM